MTQMAEVALVAQKWTNIVQSCCPGLARAEWHVSSGDVVITGWFRPRGSERDDALQDDALQKVEIAVNHSTVDDYIHAPEVVQFRANGQLIDFVTSGWLNKSFQGVPAECGGKEPEQWLVESGDLGLEGQRDAGGWRWTRFRPHFNRRSSF